MKKFTYLVFFSFVISFTFSSCASGLLRSVTGNGNVTKELREIQSFEAISASAGVNVFLFQGDEEKVIVEADENIQNCIITDVEGSTLRLYLDCSVRWSKKMNVYVNYRNINKLTVSSGADVYSETVIVSDYLQLSVSSGADAKIDVDVNTLNCNASSGADAVIRGKAQFFDANASSGADIKAEGLTVKECSLNASSAGGIRVNVTDRIKASASSGADIVYTGNPSDVNVKQSSGGDVKKR